MFLINQKGEAKIATEEPETKVAEAGDQEVGRRDGERVRGRGKDDEWRRKTIG